MFACAHQFARLGNRGTLAQARQAE
jgi:hypothetical protein